MGSREVRGSKAGGDNLDEPEVHPDEPGEPAVDAPEDQYLSGATKDPETEQSLGTRTIRGMFWSYGSYVGGRIMVLVAIAILARLLSPRDFGLVALATALTALLETIKDFGLGQALVVGKEEDLRERADTAFWWGLVIGVCGCLVILVTAPWVADFYNEPKVLPILAVLSLNFPLKALGATHEALAQRWMNFHFQTAAQLSAVAVRGVTGVTLALLGFGPWAIVLGYLAGTASSTAVYWLMVPWRPRLHLPRGHARELFTFGGTLTAVDVLHGIWASADSLVIGRVLGATALGVYGLALRLPELLILYLSLVAASVLFPAFSKVDFERLREVLVKALRYTLIIGAPIAAGLIVLGDSIIPALFGPQWEGAVAPMRVICIYSLLLTLEIPGGTIFKVTGRASILLKLAIVRTIMLYAALILFAHYGLVAVGACLAGVTALFAAIAIVIACRVTGASLVRILLSWWAPLISAAGAGAAMYLSTESLSGDWPRIIVGVVVGAVTYAALLWMTARDALDYLLRKAMPQLSRA
jgi:O-antigen/teichoic acid export membrane protein